MKAGFLFLFLSWLPHAVAAEAGTPLWEAAIDGKPRAVFFNAGQGNLLVSVDGKDGAARLDSFSLEGKIAREALAGAEGTAGPLRVYLSQIFWIVGGKLRSLSLDGRPAAVPPGFEPGGFTDVTVLRGGKPLAVGVKGVTSVDFSNAEYAGASGVFLREETPYVLYRGNRLRALGAKAEETICAKSCRGLERSSAGEWLTTEGRELLAKGEKGRYRRLLAFATEPGRPAYVYRKEPKEDFVVVPFPEEGKLRAYRAAPEPAEKK